MREGAFCYHRRIRSKLLRKPTRKLTGCFKDYVILETSSSQYTTTRQFSSPVAADDLVIQVRRQALEVNVVVHEDELQLHGAAEI